MDTDIVQIPFDGRSIDIEYQWLRAERMTRPLVVFLHEGLGSISMWRDFPRQFCEAGDFRGLVFSRYGYGGSTPRPHAEKWGVDFMHRQAREALPALFEALDIGLIDQLDENPLAAALALDPAYMKDRPHLSQLPAQAAEPDAAEAADCAEEAEISAMTSAYLRRSCSS